MSNIPSHFPQRRPRVEAKAIPSHISAPKHRAISKTPIVYSKSRRSKGAVVVKKSVKVPPVQKKTATKALATNEKGVVQPKSAKSIVKSTPKAIPTHTTKAIPSHAKKGCGCR